MGRGLSASDAWNVTKVNIAPKADDGKGEKDKGDMEEAKEKGEGEAGGHGSGHGLHGGRTYGLWQFNACDFR